MKYKIIKEQTLLEALIGLFPSSSKTTLRDFLKQGRILLEGKIEKLAATKVLIDQEIELLDKEKLLDDTGKIKIIYQDSHLIAIEKPSGMLSVSTAFEKKETAHGFLKKSFKPNKVHVVHRLDQDTSGVMIFALSLEAYTLLKKMFEKHELERAYTAIVEGHLEESKGTWQSYLVEDDNYVVRETKDSTLGRMATTHYEVVASSKKYSALVLHLETGRKNQIRVHCQNANHPVVGDKKYGSIENPIKRLALHAHLLSFIHPITKKKMVFKSALPVAFQKFNLPNLNFNQKK